MPAFREEFEPPHGLRFWRGSVSLKLRGYALTEHLNAQEMLSFADSMHRFADTMREAVGLANLEAADEILGPSAFPLLVAPRLFKCVSPEVWERYLSKGSVQLGSAPYYQRIEKQESRDRHEGFCQLAFTSGRNQMHWHVEAGSNAWLFCGTRDLESALALRPRFGGVVVEIVNFVEMVKHVAEALGAVSVAVRDVVYTNAKLYSLEQDFSVARKVLTGPLDTSEAMSALNSAFFDPLYIQASIIGLNTKPRAFAAERERRVVFEMPADLATADPIAIALPEIAPFFQRVV